MKTKFFTLLFCVVSSLGLWAQEVKEIRPAESAFVGFFQPTDAPVMTNLGNGIFTWVGKMKPGEFTFTVNGTDWGNRIFSSQPKNGDTWEEIVLGQEHDIILSFNGAASDLKFQMTEAEGWYRMTIDINELTMLIENSTMVESVYEIRPAEGAFVDFFEPRDASIMRNLGNGIFTWVGKMKPGVFTFTVNGEDWRHRVFSSTTDENIVIGQEHDIILSLYGAASDLKFVMPAGTNGWYKVTIDINELTMLIENSTVAESVYEIRPAESAFVDFFEPKDATPMSDKGNGVFEWIGQMKPGVFTFTVNGTDWKHRIYSTVQAGETIALGTAQNIELAFSNERSNYKFVMADEQGWYKMTIDISAGTILIEKTANPTTNIQSVIENDVKVGVYDSMIKLTSSNIEITKVDLYDISGKKITSIQQPAKEIGIAIKLNKGIYIVEYECNHKSKVQKVLVY